VGWGAQGGTPLLPALGPPLGQMGQKLLMVFTDTRPAALLPPPVAAPWGCSASGAGGGDILGYTHNIPPPPRRKR